MFCPASGSAPVIPARWHVPVTDAGRPWRMRFSRQLKRPHLVFAFIYHHLTMRLHFPEPRVRPLTVERIGAVARGYFGKLDLPARAANVFGGNPSEQPESKWLLKAFRCRLSNTMMVKCTRISHLPEILPRSLAIHRTLSGSSSSRRTVRGVSGLLQQTTGRTYRWLRFAGAIK